ncbi:MAG: DNA primase DnaG, partial [Candidatus Thermoplasmatota archaeon]|nr:DNA primase DnaG [Candidatus Thermoplasmatota archaeon]
MAADTSASKYLIKATISTDGVVEHPDVVGAIFGQSEGLLGEELDLRDLQRSTKIGRITVELDSKRGKTEGTIEIPSNLDQVETAILAAALESIDRVGPCTAKIEVTAIDDVRVSKRKKVMERAKTLLKTLSTTSDEETRNIAEKLRGEIRVAELVYYGPDHLPAGPNVGKTDSVIIVEGRNDVLNLLRSGINNVIAVEGTSVPKTIIDISRDCTTTAFVDGDRGGELILKELLSVCEIDYVTRAPEAREVEELAEKQIMKCLKNKVPADQYMESYGIVKANHTPKPGMQAQQQAPRPQQQQRPTPQQAPRPQAPVQQASAQAQHHPVPSQTTLSPSVQSSAPAIPIPPPVPAPAEHRGGIFSLISGKKAEEKKDEKQDAKKEEPMDKYKSTLERLSGSLKAVIYDANDSVIGNEILVRDIADAIKSANAPATVVLDGVVTQRLLDVAGEKGIKLIVASKMGPVSKHPANVKVLTKDNFQ